MTQELTARRSTSREFAEFTRAVINAPGLRDARKVALAGAAELTRMPWIALTEFGPPREVAFVAASHDVVRRVGRIAAAVREGVCWQLYADCTRSVAVADLAGDHRWPSYRQAILEHLPVRSALGVELRVGQERHGAIMFYSDRAGHYSEPIMADAAILADHAAVALAHVRSREKSENLEIALKTSREIGIALGIMMERLRIVHHEALELLRTASQQRHIKIHELAARIALTGELPEIRDSSAT